MGCWCHLDCDGDLLIAQTRKKQTKKERSREEEQEDRNHLHHIFITRPQGVTVLQLGRAVRVCRDRVTKQKRNIFHSILFDIIIFNDFNELITTTWTALPLWLLLFPAVCCVISFFFSVSLTFIGHLHLHLFTFLRPIRSNQLLVWKGR